MDIKHYCHPLKLTVFVRYTRRGDLTSPLSEAFIKKTVNNMPNQAVNSPPFKTAWIFRSEIYLPTRLLAHTPGHAAFSASNSLINYSIKAPQSHWPLPQVSADGSPSGGMADQ
jgi:hypothetical protein